MDKKIIVARIEELMREKGITKYDLQTNTELSSTIYQWKKNAQRDRDRIPSLKSIEKVCDYLGVSLSYFFTFDKKDQRDLKNQEIYSAICKLSDEQINLIEGVIKQFK